MSLLFAKTSGISTSQTPSSLISWFCVHLQGPPHCHPHLRWQGEAACFKNFPTSSRVQFLPKSLAHLSCQCKVRVPRDADSTFQHSSLLTHLKYPCSQHSRSTSPDGLAAREASISERPREALGRSFLTETHMLSSPSPNPFQS